MGNHLSCRLTLYGMVLFCYHDDLVFGQERSCFDTVAVLRASIWTWPSHRGPTSALLSMRRSMATAARMRAAGAALRSGRGSSISWATTPSTR